MDGLLCMLQFCTTGHVRLHQLVTGTQVRSPTLDFLRQSMEDEVQITAGRASMQCCVLPPAVA
jgi:hypothetical protein